MWVHRQCFLFKLKYANEQDGFASVFCLDWVSQWGITEESKSGLLLQDTNVIAQLLKILVYLLQLIKIFKQTNKK